VQQRVGTTGSQPPGERNPFEAFDVLQGTQRFILWLHAYPLSPCEGSMDTC